MLQYQLKLRTTKAQEATLREWLWQLTGVWNWASRKIELDAAEGQYHNAYDLQGETAGHASRIGLPSRTLQGLISDVCKAWQHCFMKLAKRPRLKGARRKLNSIPFPDPIKPPKNNRITLPILGKLRFHKQKLPQGKIKCGRLIKKASGWYLCVFIDTFRKPIVARPFRSAVGIDPGFKSLLTLSNGEKVSHPRELEACAKRLAQAQRGGDKALTARLHERIANQKKGRNHKLSLRLVQEFHTIYFSNDNIQGVAKKFGKSVSSSNHYQLRQMLKYKSLAGGTKYVEVDSKFSTRTCSACEALTGPTSLPGLKVRNWVCSGCGATHDRDANAAVNTLNFAAGRAVERAAQAARPEAVGNSLMERHSFR